MPHVNLKRCLSVHVSIQATHCPVLPAQASVGWGLLWACARTLVPQGSGASAWAGAPAWAPVPPPTTGPRFLAVFLSCTGPAQMCPPGEGHVGVDRGDGFSCLRTAWGDQGCPPHVPTQGKFSGCPSHKAFPALSCGTQAMARAPAVSWGLLCRSGWRQPCCVRRIRRDRALLMAAWQAPSPGSRTGHRLGRHLHARVL